MMRLMWRIARLWLAPAERYRLLREAVRFRLLPPAGRRDYRMSRRVARNVRQMCALGLLLQVVDRPTLFIWFAFSNLLFLCLTLARILARWRG